MRRPDWTAGDHARLERPDPLVTAARFERLFELDRRGHLQWAMSWKCPELRCPQVGHGLYPGWCTDHDLKMVESC